MSEKEDENTFSFDDIGKSGSTGNIFGDGYSDLSEGSEPKDSNSANFDDIQNGEYQPQPDNNEVNYETSALEDTDFSEFTNDETQGYSNNDFGIPSQINNQVKFNNGTGKNPISSNAKVIFALLFVLLLVAVGLFVFPKDKLAMFGFGSKNKDVAAENVVGDGNTTPMSEEDNSLLSDEMSDMSEMSDVNTDDNGSELDLVSYSVETSENANPFLPFNEANYGERSAHIPADLIAPPETISTESSDAQQIIKTKVSGIMYDSRSPSAILNIGTQDYLVRSGDVINGYKVLLITPNYVTVQLGDNIYKAGVGEAIQDKGELNYNDVYNLQNKFGGANKNKGI